MAMFTYKAVDSGNEYVKGSIEGKNEKSALVKLEKEGFLVVSIEKVQKPKVFNLNRVFQEVTRLDKIFFTRHLHTMLESGMSLDEAIKITAEQTANETFKKILFDIHKQVRKGEMLHEALGRYPKNFNNFFIQFIRVGEKSGKLDEVLEYLLEQQEKDYELLSQARGAMIYPSLILTAMLGVVILMMVFVIPKVTSILSEYEVDLPLATKILIGLSNFIVHYGLIAFPFLVLAIYGIKRWTKSKQGRPHWHSFLLSLPRFKYIIKEYNLARFSRAMTALLKSGVTIDEALLLSSQISNNYHYQSSISESVVFVRKGIPLGEILKGKSNLYPPIATRMIDVGEKTGKLDHMFERLASFYEKSVTRTLTNFASVIEPVLLLAIGFSVGFVAISILTPIWKFSETVA